MEKKIAAYALTLLPALFFTLLIHLRLKERLMLVGITLMGMAGVVIVYRTASVQLSFSEHRWILPLLFISLASFGAGILMTRSFMMRLTASAASLLLLILTLNGIMRPLFPGVFLAMGIILISLCDEIQIRWKKEGFIDRKAHLVFTVPFISAILIIASLIQYPKEPYDWRQFLWLRDCALSLLDRIEYSFLPASDAVTGFSDRGMLMTGLKPSSSEVMKVTTFTDLDAPVYFSGRIYDRFDGRGWDKNDASDIRERSFDVIESISSVMTYSDKLNDYYMDTKLSLSYIDTKSHYLFAPSKLAIKDTLSGRSTVREKGGDFVFDQFSPYHLSLSESYLRPNSDNPGFYNFMQSDTFPGENQWKEALSVLNTNDRNDCLSYEQYQEYRRYIKKIYSEDIPLSDRLSERLAALYEGAGSDYEKFKRLEASMQRMTYTLDPTPIPDGVDSPSAYLDYFLLGEGGGYCSYYATAFVLLARAEGFPARYVQGYRVPTGKKGEYIVTSDMAHAWPEVYFNGKGWIAFEPTPGFYTGSVWPMSSENVASSFVPPSVTFEPPVKTESDAVEPVVEDTGISLDTSVIIVPAALIAVFFISFLIINRTLLRHRLRVLDDKERVLFLARDCLNILSLLGSGLRKGETLCEYHERIKSTIDQEALNFIPDYETVLYAKPESLAVSNNSCYECRQKLLKLLKEQNRLRYIIKILL